MTSHAHIIRYLEHNLAACRARPELHRHQTEAYERLLDVARSAPDAAGYHRELAARGLTLAAMRAEWLDRYHAAACVHRALGDEAQRRAAAARFHAGRHSDFLAAITRAEQQTAARTAAARASQDALAPLLMTLLDWRLEERDAPRRRRLRELHGLWGVIQENDPGCTWERICAYPPYRHRVPFDSAGLALLGEWLARALACPVDPPEAAPAAAAPRSPTPPDGPDAADEPAAPDQATERARPDAPAAEPMLPTARMLAQAYHAIYDAQDWTGRDLTRQVYERIFALEDEIASEAAPGDGVAFLCRMAEEGLPTALARAPHAEWAEALRAHGQDRAQPVMAHHAGALAAAIAACPTATAVEHERMQLDACFDVESAWDQILVHYALCTVTAVLAGASGAGPAVRDSARIGAALFGATWDALLATPRLRDFFDRELVPAMFGRQPIAGARRGEAGGAILQAAAGHVPKPDSPGPAAVRDHIAALVTAALARSQPTSQDAPPEPQPAAPGPARSLILWGRPVTLDQLADRLAAPPRPAIALDDHAATAISPVSRPHPP